MTKGTLAHYLLGHSQEAFLAEEANSLIVLQVVLHRQVAFCSLLSWLCRCSVHMGNLVHCSAHLAACIHQPRVPGGELGSMGLGSHDSTLGQQGGVCVWRTTS